MILWRTEGLRVVGAVVAKEDIAILLRHDRGGTELRRMQRELKLGRDSFCADPGAMNREAAAKAFDAGIALLPELWRLEQRK